MSASGPRWFWMGALALGLLLPASWSSVAAAPPPGFVIDNPFPTATFNFPMQIVFLPDGRRLVAEKAGRIWVVDANGIKYPFPFIDLRPRVLETGDRGLMGVALDPDYATNRWVYLLYTVDPDSDGVDVESGTWSRVERYQRSATNPNELDLTTRQILIGVDWPSGIPAPGSELTHVVGTLRFGRDKTLLVGSGDAALYNSVDRGGAYPAAFGPGRTDPAEDIGAFRAQSLNSMCGKILRLDKETGHGLPSNPYWDGNPTSARSRVWVYGFRNPFRFGIRPGSGSTDPADAQPGTLYVADVGWNAWEELNIVRDGGENYGWPCVEGFVANSPYLSVAQPPAGCQSYGSYDNPLTPTAPDYAWSHYLPQNSIPPGLNARAIIAGAYYNGSTYPVAYRNKLFIADFVTSWIHVVDLDASDNPLGMIDFLPSGASSPGDLEVDPVTGDVWYVGVYSGAIRRIRYVIGNHDPFAIATLSPTYGPAPLLVTGNASASTDADLDPLQFVWRFGDGDSATTAIASHTYAGNGVYGVELEVRDPQGAVDRRAWEVVVGQVPPPGHVVLPARGRFFDVNDLVRLQAVQVDTTAGPVRYRWDIDLGHDTHFHLSQQVLFGASAEYVFQLHEDNARYFNRIRLEVTQGPFTVHDTVEVFPQRNLQVGDFAVSPITPLEGDSFTVHVVLRSDGGIGTHDSRWRIRDGVTTIASEAIAPLAGGDSLVIARRLASLAPGVHTLTLEADPDNEMTETSESDNTATLLLQVRTQDEPFAEWSAEPDDELASLRAPQASRFAPPLPWRDRVSGYFATLVSVSGPTTGWFGDGSLASPYRLELDGLGGHVKLGEPAAIEPLQRGGACSAELWLRPGADVTRTQTLIEWLEASQSPYAGMSLAIANGRLRVDLDPWQDAGPIAPHTWTHVVVAKSIDSAKVFVDGRQVLAAAHANRGPQWTEARLGASVRGGVLDPQGFEGALSLLRLYDAALGVNEARVSFRADSAKFLATPRPLRRLLAWAADSANGTGPHPEGDATNVWRDLAGDAHDATLAATPRSDTSGWLGAGTALSPWRLELDGLDDRATVPTGSIAELAAPESLSVAMWFRAGRDVDRAQTLLEWDTPAASPWRGFGVGIEAGQLQLHADGWQPLAAIGPGAWHHLLVSEAAHQRSAWLDGEPIPPWNCSSLGPPGGVLALGATPGPAASFTRLFRGALARVEVWRGIVTGSAAESIYTAQKAPFVHAIEADFSGVPWLSTTRSCLTLPYVFERTDSLRLRGFSVTLKLDATLALCGTIAPGAACASVPTAFQTRTIAPGTWVIDAVALGAECMRAEEPLFEVPVSATISDGSGRVSVLDVRVRDCDNHALAADRGAALLVRIDHTAPTAPAAVECDFREPASGVAATNSLRVRFDVAADVESVSVFRAPFGNAPAYDDPPNPGSSPPTPTWPPAAPWQRTTLAWGGREDHVDVRDCWSYAAFAWDSAGNRSAPTASNTCMPNYRLGDVTNGAQRCQGDGLVGSPDLAELIAHYGRSLAPNDSLDCLDVGPTLDWGRHSRPLTDSRLDFEDLMNVALDYDARAPVTGAVLGPDNIHVNVPSLADSAAEVRVEVIGSFGGRLHGLSVRISYDSTVVQPVSATGSTILASQLLPSVVATPGRGVFDLAMLGAGPGLTGSGIVGSLLFHRLAFGDPRFLVATVIGRDSLNAPVSVGSVPGVLDADSVAWQTLTLSPGTPNPFRDRVVFDLTLPRPAAARLVVYDVQGRRIRTLLTGGVGVGRVRFSWDGRDERGIAAPPGIYLARLESLGETRTRRIVRLR